MMIEWCADDLEKQLITASKIDIQIGDTAVGMEDFKQAAPKFMEDQWAEILAKREKERDTTQT